MNNKAEVQATIDQLERKISKLAEDYRNKRSELEGEISRQKLELHKCKLADLIGVAGGVRTAIRTGHKLDDSFGTLLKINGTRCVVEFNGEEWTFSIDGIREATKEQGWMMK